MKYKKWNLAAPERSAVEGLRRAGLPALAALVLCARGLDDPAAAQDFLSAGEAPLHDPFLLRDMDKAAARLTLALERGESIAVYGDYDVDGITSTCLLTQFLRSRGGQVIPYIPDRLEEGYGLNREAVDHLHQAGVSLIVTVDCGITAAAETEYANSLGMEVIITDHHECKEVLPAAAAVVDPHRSDCGYPFPCLAGVGVALKLALALTPPEERQAVFESCSDLAAVGTVADVMSLTGENRTIVRQGLRTLAHTKRPGFKALIREAGAESRCPTATGTGFTLAPRINAAGRMGAAELAADLLLTGDEAQAERLARELCELNRERQAVEQEIYAQAVEQIENLPASDRRALVLSSEVWHQGVVGIVASRLSEKYSCPSFMIHLQNGMGKGSCRSYGGFNLFSALESCADLLTDFGGHALAAGFNIREEDIPAFRRRMNRCVSEFLGDRQPVSSLDIDVTVRRPEVMTLEEVRELGRLEPYGAGNNRPVFALMGAKVESLQSVGQNRHLKLRLSKGSCSFDAIFFSASAESYGVSVGSRVDAAFHLQINEFRGVSSVQMQLLDLRPAVSPSTREQECLRLVGRLKEGQPVSVREAERLLPARDQFIALWRAAERLEREGASDDVPRLPALRRLAAALNGAESFLRAAAGMEIFAERGLITLSVQGERLTFHTRPGQRADLERSAYVARLRRILGREGKGGR